MAFWNRWRRDRELDEEIAAHLAMAARDREARGESHDEARQNARCEFGNSTRLKEATREVWGWAWLERLGQDVRYALRQMRHAPGFTFVVVLTLALGVGANTAIFSLVHTLFLRALPFSDADRLVMLYEDLTKSGGPAAVEVTPAAFVSWRDQNQQSAQPVFEGVAAIDGFGSYNLVGEGDPEQLNGAAVSGNLFQVLGLKPLRGRILLPEDDAPGAPPVVVISEALWRGRFAADPGVVGRSLNLNGIARTVVGIVPGTFRIPNPTSSVWMPIQLPPDAADQRGNFSLKVVARLHASASMQQAKTGMTRFAANLARRFPNTDTIGTTIRPLREEYAGGMRSTMALLLGTVGLVLLIACVNVAQLLLARGTARQREIAMRGALGAERLRLFRQLLTESLVLAAMGAVAGTGVAASTFWFLARLVPRNFPDGATLTLDVPVLLFTAALAAITAVVFGTGPALAALRFDLNDVLKQGGRGATRRGTVLRGAMISTEVAMTVVLLAGAGLLLRSYAELRATDPGFATDHLLVAETTLAPAKYQESAARKAFYEQVLSRVKQLPGVVSAGYTTSAPIVFKGGRAGFRIKGRPAPTPGQLPPQTAVDRVISHDYLETMRIPIVEGRRFDTRDHAGSSAVAIVNQAMAKTFWPGQSPIGQQVHLGRPQNPWLTIVGVMGDVRQMEIDEPSEPEIFFSLAQDTHPGQFFWPRHLVVRTQGDPTGLANAIRQAVWSVDATQPVTRIRPMTEVIDGDLIGRNTQLTLVATFALLALLLASVGLYGLLSFSVSKMTPELGLRMALGAQRPQLVGMVLRRTLMLTGVGLALGIGAAFALSRFMEAFLYETAPRDPLTLAGVAVLILAVALAASFLPAMRAASVDPTRALRIE